MVQNPYNGIERHYREAQSLRSNHNPNPYNGIESDTVEATTTQPMPNTRIHTMELKGPGQGVRNSLEHLLNPYNGIERMVSAKAGNTV